jgi:predicted membrane-bound mannosyltransferase
MKRCAIVLLLVMLAALGISDLALAGQESFASKQAPVTVSAAEFLASLAAPTAGGSCAAIPGETSEIGLSAPLATPCTNTCTTASQCPRCPRICPAQCINGCCLCPCR